MKVESAIDESEKEDLEQEDPNEHIKILRHKLFKELEKTGEFGIKDDHFVTLRDKDDYYVKQHYDESSWECHIYHFIDSKRIESLLLFLLVIDILAVIAELFLEAEFPSCEIIERRDYITSCCDHDHRFLASGSDSHECPSGFVEGDHTFLCDSHNEYLHVAHDALFGLSVTCLIIFEIELLAKLFILRSAFLKSKFYVADLIVVTTSLIIDMTLRMSPLLFVEMATLLIFARIWRFVRIIHGALLFMSRKINNRYFKKEQSVPCVKVLKYSYIHY